MLRTPLLLLVAIAAPAAAPAAETVPAPAFRSIELRGGGSVVLRHGPVQRITLIDGSTAHTGLRVHDDGALRIDVCRGRCPRSYNLRIEIVSPSVPHLAIWRGGRISAAQGFPPQATLGTAIHGGGQIDTRSVRVRRVSVALSRGGQILVWAEQTLNAALSGGGQVGYRGNPAVRTATAGAGMLSQIR